MDGVLIDSVPIQLEAFRIFFSRYGVPFDSSELERFNGPSTREILQTMKEEHRLPYAIDAAVAERNRIGWTLLGAARPFPKARRVVECFRLRGYKVALASSAPREIIARLCGDWEFDAICSGEDVPRSKPDPGIFLMAAKGLGLPVSLCAVVEDSPLGVEAAKRAGMFVVGLTSTVKAERLSNANAVIDDIGRTLELPHLMAGQTLLRTPQPVSVDDIVLAVSPTRPSLPEPIAGDVEKSWCEALAKGAFNSLIANLVRYRIEGSALILEANTTDYKTYQGIRRRADYDVFAHDICVLGTSSLVETADGTVLFARRPSGLVGGGLWYNVPGGLLDIDESTSPKASVFGELRGELGLGEEHIRSCALVGIGHDNFTKGAELMFVMTTYLTSAEVKGRHAQAVDSYEAEDLRAVPVGELSRWIQDEPTMPASRALAEIFLETRRVR